MALGKLKSDTGASLTMALLVFLVCAVAGSIVLTAATSAAGRISELPEMDRRYYSVSSAARLLAEELDGTTVTIVRTETSRENKTTTYTYNEDGTPDGDPVVTTDSLDPTYDTTVNNEPAETTNAGGADVLDLNKYSFLTGETLRLLFGPDLTCNTGGAMALSAAGSSSTDSGKFALEHDGTYENADGLKVAGTYELKGGALLLKVSNGGDNPYELTVTLTATVYEPPASSSGAVEGAGTTVNSGNTTTVTVPVTDTTTKTTRVVWKVAGIG